MPMYTSYEVVNSVVCYFGSSVCGYDLETKFASLNFLSKHHHYHHSIQVIAEGAVGVTVISFQISL